MALNRTEAAFSHNVASFSQSKSKVINSGPVGTEEQTPGLPGSCCFTEPRSYLGVTVDWNVALV